MVNQKPLSLAKVVCAGGIGNIAEWYAFMVYAYLTPEIAILFFPHEYSSKARILSLLIFAAGFLARPVGAVLFGYLGDHLGRRKALLISQYLMAISTLLLCVLPTYKTLGLSAPILLTLIRILQGLSVAGEYTTALCYFAEVSPPSQRGKWVSTVAAGTALGILFSTLVVFICKEMLSSDQVLLWGWRLCFFVGFIFALIGVYMRYHLPETKVFLDYQSKVKNNVLSRIELLRQGSLLRNILRVFLLSAAYGYFYQLLFIWLPTTLSIHRPTTTLFVNIGALLIFMFSVVLSGWLSDKFSRRLLMLVGEIAIILLFYPMMLRLAEAPSLEVLIVFSGLFAFFFGLFVGSMSAFFSEVYPVPIRSSVLSLSYNIPIAIFGGLAPAVLSVIHFRYTLMGTTYVTVAIFVVAFIATLFVKEEKLKLE